MKEIETILSEIESVLQKVNAEDVKQLMKDIVSSNVIVVCGAGRMGLAGRAFSMRLRQLDLDSYAIGDSSIPHVKKGDLLLVCSGSGETETILTLAKIAKKNGAKIALVSCRKTSRIAKLSSTVVVLPAQSKIKNRGVESIQPMTTLMEQCTSLFFDAFVLQLMSKLHKKSSDMWKNHSNLE